MTWHPTKREIMYFFVSKLGDIVVLKQTQVIFLDNFSNMGDYLGKLLDLILQLHFKYENNHSKAFFFSFEL